ncbi:hypothetical protein D3C71_1583650 [compost metagenome]
MDRTREGNALPMQGQVRAVQIIAVLRRLLIRQPGAQRLGLIALQRLERHKTMLLRRRERHSDHLGPVRIVAVGLHMQRLDLRQRRNSRCKLRPARSDHNVKLRRRCGGFSIRRRMAAQIQPLQQRLELQLRQRRAGRVALETGKFHILP